MGVATNLRHKVHATITATEVAELYGVPEETFVEHLKREIAEEDSCASLPFTLFMVTIYALMIQYHNPLTPIFATEGSIIHGITEEAEFAFSSEFAAHKNVFDVDTPKDFWSWLVDGLIPFVFKQELYWSEGAEFLNPVQVVPRKDRGFLLNFNRVIGGVRFRQDRSAEQECESSSDLWAFYNRACVGGFGHELWPETWEAWGIDATEEFWLFIHDDVDVILDEVYTKETQHWMSDATRQIEIGIPAYNAGYGVYSFVTINFYVNRGGHIWKRIIAKSTIATWWKGWWNIALDVAWILGLCKILSDEIVELFVPARKLGLRVAFVQYLRFWNAVDWLSIIAGFAIVVVFMIRNESTLDLNKNLAHLASLDEVSQRAEYRAQARYLTQLIEEEVQNVFAFRRMLAVYPLVNVIRLFKAFAAQRRLSLVTRTLAAAMVDLLHFLVVFGSIFFTYVIAGIILFGREVDGFTTFPRAIVSCFRTMMGDFNWEEMSEIGRIEAGIWFMSFMVIVVMLMLNMLLAIVMDAYSEQKATEDAETLWEEAWQIIQRWNGRRQGKLVPLIDLKKCMLLGRQSDLIKIRTSFRADVVSTGVAKKSWFVNSSEDLTEAGEDHDSKWDLVTKKYLQSVCPAMRDRQAIELLRDTALEYYATHQEEADMDTMLMEMREVNFITKELKSKLDKFLMTQMDPYQEDDSQDHLSVEDRVQNVPSFLDELALCRAELTESLRWIVGASTVTETTARALRHAEDVEKERNDPTIPLTSFDDLNLMDEVRVLDNLDHVLQACRDVNIDTRNDDLRERCLGCCGRVLRKDTRSQSALIMVPSVGDIWMGLAALGKAAMVVKMSVDGTDVDTPQAPWGCNSASTNGENSFLLSASLASTFFRDENKENLLLRRSRLQDEVSAGNHTITIAEHTARELEHRVVHAKALSADLDDKFTDLKTTVATLAKENRHLFHELQAMDEENTRARGEAEAAESELDHLISSIAGENEILRDQVACLSRPVARRDVDIREHPYPSSPKREPSEILITR